MPPGEFELIERFFRRPAGAPRRARGDVALGIGDDAALLDVPAGRQLVAAIDTLVEGRHFPPGSPPASIGHRALAVNLSDLAAMGAGPAWFLLALTLPAADEAFLDGFARGMLALADAHGVALVGGDTTAGPLTVSVQVLGTVAPGTALTRAGARAGDLLYVSGVPGEAAAGLELLQGKAPASGLDADARRHLVERFEFPAPRVQLGLALSGLASACIDVSDGLAADAGKLAAASGVGLAIEVESLPVSAALRAHAGDRAARLALAGGDDYELCFSVSPDRVSELTARLQDVKCPVSRIGRLTEDRAVRVLADGRPVQFGTAGHDHFASEVSRT